ncbi:MAG: 3-deoxy-D-manno-octulosonic acid transferase [Acidiferrobacterales bacterium]|nr:3-deoxy-D-manno-octulosonic acid transferase [Acidiferrobacterales bacterium]
MGRMILAVYRTLMLMLLPVIFVRYVLKAGLTPTYRRRLTERFGVLPNRIPTGIIWVHAVSVGEVNAAVPMIENLLQTQNRPVLVTCVTPTGSAQIRKSLNDRVAHVYAPVDAGVIVRTFLRKFKPVMIVIMETEMWPNLIHYGTRAGVPVLFANMRLSDRTFAGAVRLRPFSRYVLNQVSAFCVQTEDDRQRIADIGVPDSRISVTGNLKFDVTAPPEVLTSGKRIRERLGGDDVRVVILGSSHDGEELRFLDVFERVREKFPMLLGIIVPRHPERFDAVYRIIAQRGLHVVRTSQWSGQWPQEADILLVDSMGELMNYYAACDVAVVGGSFVPVGGHNVLEPMMTGTVSIFGPQMSNFRLIARLVLSAQAGLQVSGMEELAESIGKLMGDSDLRQEMVGRGYQLLAENRGSVTRTCERLLSVL